MHDVLESMRLELAEAIEMMRPFFPEDSDDSLYGRALKLRPYRYQNGHWPDFAEIAERERVANSAAEASEHEVIELIVD
jgi:hypothetical protein